MKSDYDGMNDNTLQLQMILYGPVNNFSVMLG